MVRRLSYVLGVYLRHAMAPASGRCDGAERSADRRRRWRDLHKGGERGLRAGLDDVDDTQQEDRPAADFKHVTDLDRQREVRDPQVIARAAMNPNGDSDHRADRDIRKRTTATPPLGQALA